LVEPVELRLIKVEEAEAQGLRGALGLGALVALVGKVCGLT
jgi:hypothetical protein